MKGAVKSWLPWKFINHYLALKTHVFMRLCGGRGSIFRSSTNLRVTREFLKQGVAFLFLQPLNFQLAVALSLAVVAWVLCVSMEMRISKQLDFTLTNLFPKTFFFFLFLIKTETHTWKKNTLKKTTTNLKHTNTAACVLLRNPFIMWFGMKVKYLSPE